MEFKKTEIKIHSEKMLLGTKALLHLGNKLCSEDFLILDSKDSLSKGISGKTLVGKLHLC